MHYNVSKKIIPDNIHCNLKNDQQSLKFFGRNIPNTTGRHPMHVSALPRINKTSEILHFYELQQNVGAS